MAEINKINIKGVDYDIGGGGSNDLVIELSEETPNDPFINVVSYLLSQWGNLLNFLQNVDVEKDDYLTVYSEAVLITEELTNYGYDVNKIAQGDYNNIIITWTAEGETLKFVFTRDYVAPIESRDWFAPSSAAYSVKLSLGNVAAKTYSKVIVQMYPGYTKATDDESPYELGGLCLTVIKQRIASQTV